MVYCPDAGGFGGVHSDGFEVRDSLVKRRKYGGGGGKEDCKKRKRRREGGRSVGAAVFHGELFILAAAEFLCLRRRGEGKG